MNVLIVSPKTFRKIEGYRAYYFFPENNKDIVALEPIIDVYAPEGRGFVLIEGLYIKSFVIE